MYLNHWIHECGTSYIVWVHTFYKTRNNNSFGSWTINHIIHATTPPPCHLVARFFFKYIYCLHYMILMSEKMTSQKKLGEIKSVPYNKPLLSRTWPIWEFSGLLERSTIHTTRGTDATQQKVLARKLDRRYSIVSHYWLIPTHVRHLTDTFVSLRRRPFQRCVVRPRCIWVRSCTIKNH
jgi:hypothetical protein